MHEPTACNASGDFAAVVDELRTHETSWLRRERDGVVREQRRLHVRELAITKVLDERGAIGAMPEAGVSARTAKATLETARALESLPKVAAAAQSGALSFDQLAPLVEIATPETDAEWARRGPRVAPIDLQRMVRKIRTVTPEEAEQRHAAREFRMWWRRDTGMLAVRGDIPDIDGALVKSVFDRMIERMRPPKGHKWDTFAHRGADALVDLCRNYADVEPTGRSRPHIVIHRTGDQAEVDGIALAAATADAEVAEALVSETENDAAGIARKCGRARRAIPRDVERQVRARDLHCRVPGCEEMRRLQLHHLIPQSKGGADLPSNLAGVCPHHHQLLVPNGAYWLLGDPEQPDGLVLIHRDELAMTRGPAP